MTDLSALPTNLSLTAIAVVAGVGNVGSVGRLTEFFLAPLFACPKS